MNRHACNLSDHEQTHLQFVWSCTDTSAICLIMYRHTCNLSDHEQTHLQFVWSWTDTPAIWLIMNRHTCNLSDHEQTHLQFVWSWTDTPAIISFSWHVINHTHKAYSVPPCWTSTVTSHVTVNVKQSAQDDLTQGIWNSDTLFKQFSIDPCDLLTGLK